MEMKELLEIVNNCGFETVAELDVSTLKALLEVREMCAVNTCGMYGARWSCPPGCGEIEECDAKIKKYPRGILVQTVGDIEDSLDFEGIMDVKKKHDERFYNCTDQLKKVLDDMLPLGDGGCTRCKECTYPDAPCRFPKLASSSMEAFGLYVADVCKKNHIAYNYGPDKMCYTGCFLFH